jgi:steroid delta-isomerase-like uncharacterized protein
MNEPDLDDRKILTRRFYEELWNQWDYSIIGDLLTDDIAFHGSLDIDKTGHDGFIEYAETVRSAFPDFHNHLEETIAEGDKLAACLTYTGTHRGTIFGIEATGRQIRYAGVAILVFRDALISHVWVLGDRLALLRQLSEPEDQADNILG